jgi:primosomal protein N''
MFQLSLFKRKTAEQALELPSWLRIEVSNLRHELKEKQAALARCEKALNKLEGMLADLKQKELFDDEMAKGSKQ